MNDFTSNGAFRQGGLFAVLLLFWVMLNNALTVETVVVGVIVAAVITALFKDGMSFLTDARLNPQAVLATFLYLGYFLKELIKANIALAAIVLSPNLPIKPGIVKVRTELKSPMGRLLLANSITLTPGTLTVEVGEDCLYVHCVMLESGDVNEATQRIAAGFEKYLEVMYG
ncbi:MAG: hypothetical protein COB59_00650 [Rhodospirillaceae bacterium]|nr:MAG: hypothetical protein COB59_00650 [Rhodospirillaceae bacterium]